MAMPKDDVVVRTCNKAYIGYGLKVECGQQWPADGTALHPVHTVLYE